MDLTGKYTLDGKKPVSEPDLFKWSKWFETADRKVAVTIRGEIKVSTFFLGLDHSSGAADRAPILFETMVFGGELDKEMERCSTWGQAEEDHQRMVKRVEESL